MRVAVVSLLAFSAVAVGSVTEPAPEMTWPGFRGHEMSGVAPKATLPESWDTKQNVQWATPVPGNGWSSPIVWGDTVYVTSAVGTKPFKQPSTGLFGNDYIAELQAQGITGAELMKKIQERDNEMPEEASELRYMLYALDAKTGAV